MRVVSLNLNQHFYSREGLVFNTIGKKNSYTSGIIPCERTSFTLDARVSASEHFFFVY